MLNFCAGLTVDYLLYTTKSTHVTIHNKDNLFEVQREKVGALPFSPLCLSSY